MPMIKPPVGRAVPLGLALLLFGATHAAPSVMAASVVVGPGIAAPQPPMPQAWSFRADASTITRYMNAWSAAQPPIDTPFGAARLQDLSAQLGDGELTIHAVAHNGMFRVPVDVVGTGSVDRGRVMLSLRGARVNGFNVPDAVLRQLERRAESALEQALATSGAGVSSLVIDEHGLEVVGSHL